MRGRRPVTRPPVELDVEAEGAQLFGDQHVEGLGMPSSNCRRHGHRLVDLGAAATSSDFTVRISCKVRRRRTPRRPTSISPKRCPPNCALPPSGCWVTSEYGADRARVDLVVDR